MQSKFLAGVKASAKIISLICSPHPIEEYGRLGGWSEPRSGTIHLIQHGSRQNVSQAPSRGALRGNRRPFRDSLPIGAWRRRDNVLIPSFLRQSNLRLPFGGSDLQVGRQAAHERAL